MKPTLIVQTVFFHESDREDAYELGCRLYAALTRPIEDPLAFGPGIPVFSAVAPDKVDLNAADSVVLIPVLGEDALSQRQSVIERWTVWRRSGRKMAIFAVATSSKWKGFSAGMSARPLLTIPEGSPDRWAAALDGIVLALNRNLGSPGATLFISSAADDSQATGYAAASIRDYVRQDPVASAFFQRTELLTGERVEDRLGGRSGGGLFLSVRSDNYSARVRRQRELVAAKRAGLPVLTVLALEEGERRSFPYGGNVPTRVWMGDPAEVVTVAMLESLRHNHFLLEAERVRGEADLPVAELRSRPPELLDAAPEGSKSRSARLILHPDPELPFFEREVLRDAHPRLRLATPTTAFRRLLAPDSRPAAESPLDGIQVAMSLSDSPDVDGPEGFTRHHVVDATVHLARTLISAGAAIAYGGDFRRNGFTRLLADLVAAYNQSTRQKDSFLVSYVPANVPMEDIPGGLPLTLRHLGENKSVAERAKLTREHNAHSALYVSDMRRVMAERTFARIVMAGQATPRLEPGGDGYGGRYPGILEEAWRALEREQPLYVVGGFGGAAGLVADLLEDRETPDFLKDETWSQYASFRARAEAIDRDPFRAELKLPKRMEKLAENVRKLGRDRLRPDGGERLWNGLTREENFQLFRAKDPLTIAGLILRGLMAVAHRAAAGKFQIELVQGGVTSARGLEALAVASFEELPLSGAAEAVTRGLGKLGARLLRQGESFLPLESDEIGADWVYVGKLGRLQEPTPMPERIRAVAADAAKKVRGQGLNSLGVVAFGAAVEGDLEAVVDAMLEGLKDLKESASITWFEDDSERFEKLGEIMRKRRDVRPIMMRVEIDSRRIASSERRFTLHVRHENGWLSTMFLSPETNGLAAAVKTRVSQEYLKSLSDGSGYYGRSVLSVEDLKARAEELGRLLFRDTAADLLANFSDANFFVVHDLDSSRLPFEVLSLPGSPPPAASGGMNRWLSLEDVPPSGIFPRSSKLDRVKVLLVVDPTRNLPKAKAEGEEVKKELEKLGKRVDLKVLEESEATMDNVRRHLSGCDVFHYCGHAFFDGADPDKSALELADRYFTLREMDGIAVPRIAVVNACESGRVRGSFVHEAASFAEFFLRSGVEAYLGTFWELPDESAVHFSKSVYRMLTEGLTLQQAVTRARRELFDAGDTTWANYVLYGDGRFRLV